MQLTSKQIREVIKKEKGLSDEEIIPMVEDIKEKYEGLLSDVGADIILSRQLGVDLDLKGNTGAITKISEITQAIDSISLYARVKSIPAPKTYKSKDGSDGRIQVVYLQDDTGIIKLNLWQDKADIVKQLHLDKNDLVFVKDAGVNQYNDRIELSLRQGGQIIKDPDGFKIPKLKENFVKISELETAPAEPVDIIARITNIYQAKTFTKDDRERLALNFEVSDGIKSIRCVAFDAFAKEISSNFSRGDLVRLSDVTIKEGLYDLELYINWNSTVTKNPITNIKIPELYELTLLDVKDEKISNLEPNTSYRITGTVISINRGPLRAFKCPDCKEKVFLINNEFICEACNKQVNPDINIFSSLDIDDGTGVIRVTIFNQLLEEVFELKKEDLKKELSPDEKDAIYYKAEKKLFGKIVKITGKTRTNDFSNQLEFIANSLELLNT